MKDYKEKYEQALETVQEILSSGSDSIKMSRLKLRLQPVFPELAESENEKTRKELIDAVQGLWDNDALPMPLSEKRKDAWLAWLEKQGDPWKNRWIKLLEDANVEYQMSMNEQMAEEAVKSAIRGLEELHLWNIIKEYIKQKTINDTD